MSDKLEVIYKCRCMAAEARVRVRERVKGEDVLNYMRVVQEMIGRDHQRRSPACRAATMEYAKIPAQEDGGIGVRHKAEAKG